MILKFKTPPGSQALTQSDKLDLVHLWSHKAAAFVPIVQSEGT